MKCHRISWGSSGAFSVSSCRQHLQVRLCNSPGQMLGAMVEEMAHAPRNCIAACQLHGVLASVHKKVKRPAL